MTVINASNERKRLVADRFRRIWHVVEEIAANPGHSRLELANLFHLSERQVQDDLNLIRSDMRLPLVRRQGYRFVEEGPSTGAFYPDLREAQLLVLMLAKARQDRSIPRERLDALVQKLPGMFPVHLRPLVERTLAAVDQPRTSRERGIFAALGSAMLADSWVKLHYAPHDYINIPPEGVEPIVRPELLLPYLRSWYLVGACQQRGNASRMFKLDAVEAVTLSPVITGTNGSGR